MSKPTASDADLSVLRAAYISKPAGERMTKSAGDARHMLHKFNRRDGADVTARLITTDYRSEPVWAFPTATRRFVDAVFAEAFEVAEADHRGRPIIYARKAA